MFGLHPRGSAHNGQYRPQHYIDQAAAQHHAFSLCARRKQYCTKTLCSAASVCICALITRCWLANDSAVLASLNYNNRLGVDLSDMLASPCLVS